MKTIAGLTMSDIWASRVLRERGVETITRHNDRAEVSVRMDMIAIAHHGPQKKYRPFLHLHGELRSVRPIVPLSHDIAEVTFPAGAGEPVTAFYEFDDQQLVSLLAKGYFSPAFVPPEHVLGVEWDLPATVDSMVLSPRRTQTSDRTSASQPEQDVPVVFVRVHDLGNLIFDLASSNYDLTAYFADFSRDGGERFEQSMPDGRRQQLGDLDLSEPEVESLFDDIEVTEPDHDHSKETATDPDQFLLRVNEVAASLEAEEVEKRIARELETGTTENLYRSHVAETLRSEDTDAVEPTSLPSRTDPVGDSLLDNPAQIFAEEDLLPPDGTAAAAERRVATADARPEAPDMPADSSESTYSDPSADLEF